RERDGPERHVDDALLGLQRRARGDEGVAAERADRRGEHLRQPHPHGALAQLPTVAASAGSIRAEGSCYNGRAMRIGLGCMRLSTEPGRDEASGLATLNAAFDAGITVFDTARAYATTETDLGHNERLLARAWRSRSVPPAA